MYQNLEYQSADGVALARLNRPDKLNAIDPAMIAEFHELVAAVRADRSIRALVVTGNGRAFSAGADIAHLVKLKEPPEFLEFLESIQTAFNALEDLDRPTIAAINGLAFGGGCELALACDLRIMAEDATIGVPEIRIGALPGAGGTQRLSRMLPPAIAKQMIYFGDPLPSAAALQHGLVNAVVPGTRVVHEALKWAKRLAELPPLALKCGKYLVHAGTNADLKTGLDAERHTVSFLFATQDRREGMTAFLEKRTPRFSGR
jgi:enoyl-CoA hydratase/carnithine racemase